MQEIKSEVQEVIDNWYKNTQHDVIHYWEQDDTWFVVIRYLDKQNVHPDKVWIKLDFVRLFPSFRIQGEYHISVDKTVTV